MGNPPTKYCSNSIAALGGSVVVVFFAATTLAAPFATNVLNFTPAPGQFINAPAFADPTAALGPPTAGGMNAPSNEGVVSLGGFGGSLTLGFSETVLDDPLNPYGLDAIVFGNAFYTGGDPARRFAEAGIIEISLDTNSNGLADDAWYVIRGSSLPFAPTAAFMTQAWDNDPATPTPPANIAWYPAPSLYPYIPSTYLTSTYLLPAPFQSIPLVNPAGSNIELYFGFADTSPTLLLGDLDADNIVDDQQIPPEVFYTRPDNPFVVGITPESAGGDAFDIAWAVDPITGDPARLPGFDFIRISSGSNALAGLFGEISTEVSAVASVAAEPAFYDLNADDNLTIEDLYQWTSSPTDLTGEQTVNDHDRLAIQRAIRAGELDDTLGGTP